MLATDIKASVAFPYRASYVDLILAPQQMPKFAASTSRGPIEALIVQSRKVLCMFVLACANFENCKLDQNLLFLDSGN